jgi:mannose-6-phosphate isomerase-like protein (cupin superfamily)
MLFKKKVTIDRILETKTFRLAWINGCAGNTISAHHLKEESIVFVQQGKAIVTFNNAIIELNKNDCRVIPPNALHSIDIVEDFYALTIMAANSKFEFQLKDLIR